MNQKKKTIKVMKYFELNDHENLWDSSKDLLRGKDTVLNAYIQKEGLKTNYLKKLEKEWQIAQKQNKRDEIIKNRN